jgi:hypothetical protein
MVMALTMVCAFPRFLIWYYQPSTYRFGFSESVSAKFYIISFEKYVKAGRAHSEVSTILLKRAESCFRPVLIKIIFMPAVRSLFFN